MDLIKTADGLYTIYSSKYNETYHSKHGVLQEAQHVFLNGSGVTKKIQHDKELSVLEIGFGTGFNFFLTADLAISKGTKMIFYSVENDLLSYDDFINLNHNILFSKNPVWINFLKWRKSKTHLKQGTYRINFDNIKLFLINMDVLQSVLPENQFDAVYHDAFSPEVNPQLWTTSFFKHIRSSMKKEAILSTYSAKGSVRKALKDASFIVNKQPGPKGKREMITAVQSI